MLVHRMEARQQSMECLGADGDHRAQADRTVHAVAAADPIPEPEHVLRVDAEGADPGFVGADGHKVAANRCLTEPRHQPGSGAAGILHGLLGRERLAADDEQRLLGIEPVERHREVVAVDIAHEAAVEFARAPWLQRLVGHGGPEIAAANADVDDMADALAR